MSCPECGGASKVTSTFRWPGDVTLRYRLCKVCGHKWKSMEELDNAPVRKRGKNRPKAQTEDLFTHADKRAKGAGQEPR